MAPLERVAAGVPQGLAHAGRVDAGPVCPAWQIQAPVLAEEISHHWQPRELDNRTTDPAGRPGKNLSRPIARAAVRQNATASDHPTAKHITGRGH